MAGRTISQIGAFVLIVNGAFAQVPTVSSGMIRHVEAFPSQYVDPRPLSVWLPPGYNPDRKYAVLYMHDGRSLFDSAITWNRQEWGVDEVMTSLLREGIIRDCIVVGIWNNGLMRQSEYFPRKAFDKLVDAHKELFYSAIRFDSGVPLLGGEVVSDDYLKFVVTELKPFIDTTFSVYTNRENTFVAGSSYGGLISLYSICEYPDIFSKAACLSTHWPGLTEPNTMIPEAINRYLEEHLPDPDSHSIYFDYGTATLDTLYKPYQEGVDRIMIARGYTRENWITREFAGAAHDERSWNARLHIPLRFMLERGE